MIHRLAPPFYRRTGRHERGPSIFGAAEKSGPVRSETLDRNASTVWRCGDRCLYAPGTSNRAGQAADSETRTPPPIPPFNSSSSRQFTYLALRVYYSGEAINTGSAIHEQLVAQKEEPSMGPMTTVPKNALASSSQMRRREFLSLIGAGGAAALMDTFGAAEETATPRRPNIILIVADDLGYADIGCFGCVDIPTPNIDSLAQNGVRFTDGYVTCPVCSPSRAGFMTARYQQRFGHEFNPGPPAQMSPAFGLPPGEITVADALKAAGYVTGLVGKWHLGLKPEFHPLKRGFDEFFGFPHGGHSYINLKEDPLNPILRGTEPVDEKEYLTDAFTREAAAFIERHRTDPFFLFLSYNAVHTPMQAPDKYLKRFPNITNKNRRTYAAMLGAMDDGIGAVLRKLDETGLGDDTLIFFFSDNGGPLIVNASSNAPLSGSKGTVLEGGIRVPFIIQWRRRIPRGTVYRNPVISLDVFPTAAAAAGAQLPGDRVIDGVNLVPYLPGEKTSPPHDILFWRFGNADAVRRKNWKFIKVGDKSALFDLSADIGEKNNLTKERPDVVGELTAALAKWESGLIPPRWATPAPQRAKQATEKPATF